MKFADCSSEHLFVSSMVEPGCQKVELAYALALAGQKSYEVEILLNLKHVNGTEAKPLSCWLFYLSEADPVL